MLWIWSTPYFAVVECSNEGVFFTGKELIFHRNQQQLRSVLRGSGHPLKVKIFSAAQDDHSHYGNTFASLMKRRAEKIRSV